VGFIRYALMDMRRLDLPDASCQGIWCSASLLHLPLRTAPRAVSELLRVNRPGGPMVVFLKQRSPDADAERILDYEHLASGHGKRFFAYYTPEEARALLDDAGAEILDVTTVATPRPTDAIGWVSVLARRPLASPAL